MTRKNFQIGDLIWAKMKGFPPWPGKIYEVRRNTKEHQYYVSFYASNNYAWIPVENIVLHNDSLVELHASKKITSTYSNAINSIVNESRGKSKYHKQPDIVFRKLRSGVKFYRKIKTHRSNDNIAAKTERKKVSTNKIQAYSGFKVRSGVGFCNKIKSHHANDNVAVKTERKSMSIKKTSVIKKDVRVSTCVVCSVNDVDRKIKCHRTTENNVKKRKLKEVSIEVPVVKKVVQKSGMSSINDAEPCSYSLSSNSPKFDDNSILTDNVPSVTEYDNESRLTEDDIDDGCVHREARFLRRNVRLQRPLNSSFDPVSKEHTILKTKDNNPAKKIIGFLGLGKIGQCVVKNLLQFGYHVNIWDCTAEKCEPFVHIGANHLLTVADVIISSDVTFCCVADADAAKAVVFGNCGVLKGLEGCNGENKGYVEMTSLDPKTSQAIAHEVTRAGGCYLEAQLNESRQQANDGTLVILVCGDLSLFNACQSVFQAVGKKVFFLGPTIGTASKYNIVQNILIGTISAAVAESLTLTERIGLEQTGLLDILRHNNLDNAVLIQGEQLMIKNQSLNSSPLKRVQKDLVSGLILGNGVQQRIPIAAAAYEVYKHS